MTNEGPGTARRAVAELLRGAAEDVAELNVHHTMMKAHLTEDWAMVGVKDVPVEKLPSDRRERQCARDSWPVEDEPKGHHHHHHFAAVDDADSDPENTSNVEVTRVERAGAPTWAATASDEAAFDDNAPAAADAAVDVELNENGAAEVLVVVLPRKEAEDDDAFSPSPPVDMLAQSEH